MTACNRAPDLLEVLDMLREGGVTFDLDHSAWSPLLVWSKPPTAEGLAWLAPHTAMLTNVALGRYTGHAPARCTVCGEVAMISITATGGTRRGRKSAPFPKCWLSCHYEAKRRGPKGHLVERVTHCAGVLEIREIDFEGVNRRRRLPKKKG